MRKLLIKMLSLSLCLIFAMVVFSGCNVSSDNSNEVYAPGGEPQSFKDTDINLVVNGRSDYVIVKPELCAYAVTRAAEEIQTFIKKSTGCELPIVTDSAVQHDNTKYYLSVGQTKLLDAQTDVVVDANEINDTGTVIQRRDKTVYIAGPSDYGTLYSAYRFLFYEINFVAYASDCVTFDYHDVLKIKDFDYKWRTCFSYTVASEDCMRNRPEDTLRMYHLSSGVVLGDTFEGDICSGKYCHTATYWVSKDQYPELYRHGDQLCFTNPKSLEVAIQSGITFAKSATGPYVQLGGLDHAGYCSCDECLRQAELYGGQAGNYARFLNAVAEGIENYYIESGIKDKFTVLGLMYLAYIEAPVVQQADGTYAPIPVDTSDPKVLYHTNVLRDSQVSVGAMCVTLESCFAHPLDDPNCPGNVTESTRMLKWRALTRYMSVYDYGVNLNGFTYHFNTWSHSADTFKFLYQFDGGIYAEESTHENGITSFCCFRAFLRGQQARNPWLETDKLLTDFCNNYFGPAGPIMEKYFYTMMENWERIYVKQQSEHFGIFTPIRLSGYWTRDFILNLQNLTREATYACEKAGVDDLEIYKERIYKEYFLWLLNEHETFSAYYSDEELAIINAEIEIGRAKYDVYR